MFPLPKESTCDHSDIKPGELACIDLWGPARTTAIGGFTYSCKIIDYATRWDASVPIKSKDEARQKVYDYKAFIETQTGNKLKYIRLDNTKELAQTGEFSQWCKDNGIQLQLTAPYTSTQNDIAEQAHRTTLEATRAMLIQSGLPQQYWSLAVNYANYLKNRSPTRALNGDTPFFRLRNWQLDLSLQLRSHFSMEEWWKNKGKVSGPWKNKALFLSFSKIWKQRNFFLCSSTVFPRKNRNSVAVYLNVENLVLIVTC